MMPKTLIRYTYTAQSEHLVTRNTHAKFRNRRLVPVVLAVCAAGVLVGVGDAVREPEPPVVTPGKVAVDAAPMPAPSDAIVLFDGTNLNAWYGDINSVQVDDSRPAAWTLEGESGKGKPGGSMTVAAGTGGITTKKKFGDAQIHVEFASPAEVKGEGQERGNSGVYIQGRYEVQVLDSYKSSTYTNGQCGSIYGEHAPLVNACREPGQWQTYDIIFHAAIFDKTGKKTQNARVTVLHNGVLIQDNVEISHSTGSAPGEDKAGDGPLFLQDHGNPVRYRNIWIRPLGAR